MNAPTAPALRKYAALTVLALAALPLAACATEDSDPQMATYTPIPDQPWHQALLTATLEVESGCLVARGVDGTSYIPIFPTTLVSNTNSAPGLKVALGGNASKGRRDGATVPQACLDTGYEFWLVAPEPWSDV